MILYALLQMKVVEALLTVLGFRHSGHREGGSTKLLPYVLYTLHSDGHGEVLVITCENMGGGEGETLSYGVYNDVLIFYREGCNAIPVCTMAHMLWITHVRDP